jgi:hypothetical protein
MTKMTPPDKRPEGDDAWIDRMLDDLGQTEVPEVSADLMARVLGDAEAMLPAPGGVVAPTPLWRQIVQGLGGWTAVGGLVAAAATGFVVGLGGVEAMGLGDYWSLDASASYDSLSALDAYGWDFEEG